LAANDALGIKIITNNKLKLNKIFFKILIKIPPFGYYIIICQIQIKKSTKKNWQCFLYLF